MQGTTIIAISGKIGTGKTTLEGMLRSYYGEDQVKSYAFADGLKQAYCAIFAASADDVYGVEGKTRVIPELGITVGRFLQTFGEHGRQYNAKLWLFSVGRRIAADKPRIALITDCRFPNEAEYVQQSGGIVIRLERPAHLIPETCILGRDTNHVSETALDTYDKFSAVFANTSTKSDLLARVIEHIT